MGRARGDEQIESWWTSVLVGQPSPAHPLYGDAVDVKLHAGVLHVSGELKSPREREEVIAEAHRYLGRGIDDIDARRLTVRRHDQRRGLLDQTIVAAFPNRSVAEHALAFLRQQRRLRPKATCTLTSGDEQVLESIGAFAADARKALTSGHGVLIARVDETDAFEARELLDEDTRSIWTLVTPPVPARRTR
ncbi:MAG TPA: hypothetical protein VEL12_03055 [Candidatus Nitrosopolaris sp.]|nr:hypothetical protein [Candidatus Nitrosopolaris sp.]